MGKIIMCTIFMKAVLGECYCAELKGKVSDPSPIEACLSACVCTWHAERQASIGEGSLTFPLHVFTQSHNKILCNDNLEKKIT